MYARSLLILIALSANFFGQQTGNSASLSKQEVDAVVQQEETAFAAAYNSADAKAVAALYTEDAKVLTEAGVPLIGRADIQRVLAAGFATPNSPNTKIKIENTPQTSIAVSKDVIVVQGTSKMTETTDDVAQPPSEFLYTRVLKRQGQQWLIAAAEYARPNPWVVTMPPTSVGQSSPPKSLSLTNIGPKPLRLRRVVIVGKAADDFAQTNTCSSSMNPGASCSLNLTFQPKMAGVRNARIWFVDDGHTGIHEIRLTGRAKVSSLDEDLIR